MLDLLRTLELVVCSLRYFSQWKIIFKVIAFCESVDQFGLTLDLFKPLCLILEDPSVIRVLLVGFFLVEEYLEVDFIFVNLDIKWVRIKVLLCLLDFERLF